MINVTLFQSHHDFRDFLAPAVRESARLADDLEPAFLENPDRAGIVGRREGG